MYDLLLESSKEGTLTLSREEFLDKMGIKEHPKRLCYVLEKISEEILQIKFLYNFKINKEKQGNKFISFTFTFSNLMFERLKDVFSTMEIENFIYSKKEKQKYGDLLYKNLLIK